jgi:hypothetical protein
MPKQRNHQHHRQRGERPLRLQLPQTFTHFSPFQSNVYPEGWTTNAPNFRKLAIYYGAIAAGFLVFVLLVTLVVYLWNLR